MARLAGRDARAPRRERPLGKRNRNPLLSPGRGGITIMSPLPGLRVKGAWYSHDWRRGLLICRHSVTENLFFAAHELLRKFLPQNFASRCFHIKSSKRGARPKGLERFLQTTSVRRMEKDDR
jgi:hypothetical protein